MGIWREVPHQMFFGSSLLGMEHSLRLPKPTQSGNTHFSFLFSLISEEGGSLFSQNPDTSRGEETYYLKDSTSAFYSGFLLLSSSSPSPASIRT